MRSLKTSIFAILILASLSVSAFAPKFANSRDVRAASQCVFQLTLEEMGLSFRPEIPMPVLRLEHEIPLREFQDAVEPTWRVRPDVFTNVFVPSLNQIFLISDIGFYRGLRTLFDSMVHEFVHFIQVKYKGIDLVYFGDVEEGEAVAVQKEFRAKWGHLAGGDIFICPSELEP